MACAVEQNAGEVTSGLTEARWLGGLAWPLAGGGAVEVLAQPNHGHAKDHGAGEWIPERRP